MASSAPDFALTRTFDAPPETVFRAWTDPELLARWWGPAMFTNPVCRIDARPGGDLLVHMRSPDGIVYPMTGTLHEVVEAERLVFTAHAIEDEQGEPLLETHNTVTFAPSGDGTELTVEVRVVRSAPEAAQALEGLGAGWTQSFGKLEELLA